MELDYGLSEEQQMIKEVAREVAEKKLRPIAAEYDEKNEFPAGWDEPKVRKALEHYENQTAEDAAAFGRPSQTLMKIPRKLIPAVRRLIAKDRK